MLWDPIFINYCHDIWANSVREGRLKSQRSLDNFYKLFSLLVLPKDRPWYCRRLVEAKDEKDSPACACYLQKMWYLIDNVWGKETAFTVQKHTHKTFMSNLICAHRVINDDRLWWQKGQNIFKSLKAYINEVNFLLCLFVSSPTSTVLDKLPLYISSFWQ